MLSHALLFFSVFGGNRLWIRGLVLVTQVLCHLSHAPRPFCFSLFFKLGLTPLPSELNPSFCASHIAGITGMQCHTWLQIAHFFTCFLFSSYLVHFSKDIGFCLQILFLFKNFFCSFIHTCVHYLGHFSTLPPQILFLINGFSPSLLLNQCLRATGQML
jgi:hypothetical protein